MAWLVDFRAALQAGMAVRLLLPTSPDGRATAVERLTVIGARSSADAAAGATTLTELLDAQHYTVGLSLPDPGTPTTGTPAGRAPSMRPGPIEDVFAVEGDMTPLVPPVDLAADPDSAGQRLARPLGIDHHVFSHVAGAGRADLPVGRSIRLLLAYAFRPTVRRLLGPGLGDADADRLVAHLVDLVEASGPLPVLRIADQPYGIAPVTLLDPAQQDLSDDGFLDRLAARLGTLRESFAASPVPVIGDVGAGAGDPARDLIAILRSRETTAELGIRAVLGPELATEAEQALDPQRVAELDQARAELADLLNRLGLPADAAIDDPDLLGLLLLPDVAPVRRPLVAPDDADAPVIETPAEYLRLLRFTRHPVGDFTLAQLAADRDVDYIVAGGRPRALLFEILRLALVVTADQAARARLSSAGSFPQQVRDRWDDEIQRSTASAGGPTSIAERLQFPDPDNPLTPIGFLLLVQPGSEALPFLDVRAQIAALPDDPALLDRVLRAELGLFWHRLDAWITSLATFRLTRLRQATLTGVQLGGYGVVTGLRPERRLTPATVPAADLPPGHPGGVFDDAGNGGYVHAPSHAQATTAAILRSAHLGHAATGHGEAFSVNLSSARVRSAMQLLDGLNAGQPLAALLGYRIERLLKDARPHGPSAIALLRAAAPLVGSVLPTPAGTAPGLVAANNVVHGLRILELAGSTEGSPVQRAALAAAVPALTADQLGAVLPALTAAADGLDALGDLLLAEGVHQLVQGNPVRSGSIGDSLSGTAVPVGELDVVRTPRHGTGVTHRLLLAGPPDATLDAASGWAETVRTRATSFAEAVARSLLPPAGHIEIGGRITRADGTTEELTVDLGSLNAAAAQRGDGHLGLGALDLVLSDASHAPDADAADSALEVRLLELLGGTDQAAGAAGLELSLAADPPDGAFDLLQTLEVARGVRALVTEARSVRPDDLGLPHQAAQHQVDPSRVDQALIGARTALAQIRTALATATGAARQALDAAFVDGAVTDDVATIDPAALRTALFRAEAVGLPAASPGRWQVENTTSPIPTPVRQRLRDALLALVSRATAAVAELDRRLAAETAAGADGGTTITGLAARAEALFGRGFPVNPSLVPVGDAGRQTLAAAGQPVGASAAATRELVTRTAQVRAAAGRLHEVLVTAELVRPDPVVLRVQQLPTEAAPRWAALPAAEIPAGRMSLLAALPVGAVTAGTLAGFMIDEWLEVVPEAAQTTTVAFHYDAPTAAAPNVCLLGVLPPGIETWTGDLAVRYVDELLALAQLRAVDTDALPVLGQLLPAALGWDVNPSLPGLDVARLTAPEPL